MIKEILKISFIFVSVFMLSSCTTFCSQKVYQATSPAGNKVNIAMVDCYQNSPGCYIACYGHNVGNYKVGENIYMEGIIRVPGRYDDHICKPTGYENSDISTVQKFKDLCNQKLPRCQTLSGGCWAGGDTGGWGDL